MSWQEKEERFYFERRAAMAADLWRYIPKKLYPAIEDATANTDGYWIYLNEGWTAYDGGEDCGIIHDYTISDMKESIKTIRRKGE